MQGTPYARYSNYDGLRDAIRTIYRTEGTLGQLLAMSLSRLNSILSERTVRACYSLPEHLNRYTFIVTNEIDSLTPSKRIVLLFFSCFYVSW